MGDEKQIEALNKLLTEQNRFQAQTIRNLTRTLVIVAVCFTIILCSMVAGFFWYENQFETVETTTTELTTEGENANINNVTNGDMYNDNATHNE